MYKSVIYILAIITLINCSEIPPELNNTPTGSINEARKVLIEEYTGVRCGNCPAGSSLLQTLKEDYGDRLVLVSFHAGFFAKPYPESNQDFKTEETESLQSHLGEPLGYPAAVVNRKVFDGGRILSSNEWALRIQQELETEVGLQIDLNAELSSNMIGADVTISLGESFEEDLFITIYIVEDNIIDAQATPQEILLDYKHHAILRKILTPIIGESINIKDQGDTFQKSYSQELDSSWNANELSVVAFVHKNGESLDVLQANEILLRQ